MTAQSVLNNRGDLTKTNQVKPYNGRRVSPSK